MLHEGTTAYLLLEVQLIAKLESLTYYGQILSFAGKKLRYKEFMFKEESSWLTHNKQYRDQQKYSSVAFV